MRPACSQPLSLLIIELGRLAHLIGGLGQIASNTAEVFGGALSGVYQALIYPGVAVHHGSPGLFISLGEEGLITQTY